LSYPLVGRICATFGELAFTYQLTLTTKIIAHKLNCYNIYKLMNIVMGLIFIAQIFCWYGVLYQKDMMHVIEESIWAFSMCIIGKSYLYFYYLTNNFQKKKLFMFAFKVYCIYLMFMLYVDIPMYYNRINYKDVTNQINKTFFQSIKDMSSCNKISKSYITWKHEIPWMTGYFIGATYLSISLIKFHNMLV
jgi:hypothetical protein